MRYKGYDNTTAIVEELRNLRPIIVLVRVLEKYKDKWQMVNIIFLHLQVTRKKCYFDAAIGYFLPTTYFIPNHIL